MDGPVEITKHYLISGRVQGVGFRAFTERNARQLGLLGWVRNLEDGRVEALARGRSDVLLEFEERVRHGPNHGRVDALIVDEWDSTEALTGFNVGKDSRQPCSKK